MSRAHFQAGRLRWSISFLFVLAVFTLPLAWTLIWPRPPILIPPGAPVVFVELARPAAPPEPPSEKPPGPSQVRAEAPSPRAIDRLRPLPKVEVAEIILPQRPEVARRESVQPPAPETTAPTSRPAPPAPVAASALPTWQGEVLARLNGFKRYPITAERRGQEGVAYVRFVMDRNGKVLSSRLERSSGVGALDREAVELPRRAQPLPKPPTSVQGETLELVTPIEFFQRR